MHVPGPDCPKAFERRRKLSKTVWVSLGIFGGLTLAQAIVGLSFASAGIALAMLALAWSERRVCEGFALNDPKAALSGFWNQLILGVLAGAYLCWQAAHTSGLGQELASQGLPDELAAGILPAIREGYLLTAALVLISQIALALFYLRVRHCPCPPLAARGERLKVTFYDRQGGLIETWVLPTPEAVKKVSQFMGADAGEAGSAGAKHGSITFAPAEE